MGKISTSIKKASFSPHNVNEYKLSILCGVDSLYYCVISQLGEVLALKCFDLYSPISSNEEAVYTTIFKEIWETDDILALPFPKVQISFIRPHYTIIPNRLFQESNKASYLTPLKAEAAIPELCQVNRLDSLEAKLIFSLPQAAIEFFESRYHAAKVTYYNSFTPLINAVGRKMEHLTGKHLWLNIHPNLLQILFFEGKDLIFSNQFSFQTEKDFLYYVLLVFNQFQLSPEHTPVHITGQLVEESAIYKKLYRYIRYVSFHKIDDTYQLSQQLMSQPDYFFFDLLAIGNEQH